MELQLFSPCEFDDIALLAFRQSELGRLQAHIPFAELAANFGHLRPPRHNGGRPAHLDIRGGLALMFLKSHLGLSDRALVLRLNSDIFLQLFCFTRIKLTAPIRDTDLVGRWRRFFGLHMDMNQLQDQLAQHWRPEMKHTNVLMDDATCYESDIKYPTDVKLLFDCCKWLHREVLQVCKFYDLPKPRDYKYMAAFDRASSYLKLKRKPQSKTNSLKKSLLYWLDQWQAYLQRLLNHGAVYHRSLDERFYQRLKVIRIIYQQQNYMLTHRVRRVAHRIVSLYKPYLRPIIRGKERKRYEFGAKVHMSQVDGLNFIEHLSFEAFHEGNRMWSSIARHKKRFGRCTHYAGDQIYANNKNRKRANHHGVTTSFKRKGAKAKDEKQRQQMRSLLAKERSTRLEGSFGTEKRYYGAHRIKARTQATEVAWIFFAVHTANAVRLTRRKFALNKHGPPSARAA